MFSCEVFQHLDSARPIESYIRESYRVLAPGGTLCFQLPVQGAQPKSFLSSPLRAALLRLLRLLGRRRMMMYRLYPAEFVFDLMRTAGFEDLELRLFHPAGHGGFHPYFLGRKGSAPASGVRA